MGIVTHVLLAFSIDIAHVRISPPFQVSKQREQSSPAFRITEATADFHQIEFKRSYFGLFLVVPHCLLYIIKNAILFKQHVRISVFRHPQNVQPPYLLAIVPQS
jgi:hypothetical protein